MNRSTPLLYLGMVLCGNLFAGSVYHEVCDNTQTIQQLVNQRQGNCRQVNRNSLTGRPVAVTVCDFEQLRNRLNTNEAQRQFPRRRNRVRNGLGFDFDQVGAVVTSPYNGDREGESCVCVGSQGIAAVSNGTAYTFRPDHNADGNFVVRVGCSS